MTVITQEFWQVVNMNQELLQLVERSSQIAETVMQELAQAKSQPRLWIGDWGSAPLPAIALQETAQLIEIKIAVPQVAAEDLEIEIGTETVLIQALQSDTAIVEGCGQFSFSPGHFHSLIPLPCRVHPELIRAELYNGVLELTLAKSGAIQRQGFKFKLAAPALPIPSQLSAESAACSQPH
jgi:HSP20 family protein